MKKETTVHRIMRKVVSRLANFTPNVVYYPSEWPARINGLAQKIAASKGDERSALTMSAMSMACAMHEHLRPGDEAEISLTGVTRFDENVGDFVVIVRRAA